MRKYLVSRDIVALPRHLAASQVEMCEQWLNLIIDFIHDNGDKVSERMRSLWANQKHPAFYLPQNALSLINVLYIYIASVVGTLMDS